MFLTKYFRDKCFGHCLFLVRDWECCDPLSKMIHACYQAFIHLCNEGYSPVRFTANISLGPVTSCSRSILAIVLLRVFLDVSFDVRMQGRPTVLGPNSPLQVSGVVVLLDHPGHKRFRHHHLRRPLRDLAVQKLVLVLSEVLYLGLSRLYLFAVPVPVLTVGRSRGGVPFTLAMSRDSKSGITCRLTARCSKLYWKFGTIRFQRVSLKLGSLNTGIVCR